MGVSKYREMTIIMKSKTHCLCLSNHESVSLVTWFSGRPLLRCNAVVTIREMSYAWLFELLFHFAVPASARCSRTAASLPYAKEPWKDLSSLSPYLRLGQGHRFRLILRPNAPMVSNCPQVLLNLCSSLARAQFGAVSIVPSSWSLCGIWGHGCVLNRNNTLSCLVKENSSLSALAYWLHFHRTPSAPNVVQSPPIRGRCQAARWMPFALMHF